MKNKNLRESNQGADPASSSRPDISRRAMLKKAATALGGGAGTLVGGAALAGSPGQSRVAAPARNAEPVRPDLPRVTSGSAPAPRCRSSSCCRSDRGRSSSAPRRRRSATRRPPWASERRRVTQATIPAHGGVGIVIEVGVDGRSRASRRPRHRRRPGAMRLLLQLSARTRRSLPDGRRRREGRTSRLPR